MSDFVHSNSI